MPTTLKFNKQNIVNHATLSFTGTKIKKKDWKISFWDKFGPKNLYFQFELKFGA